jgi:S1-C subfamily serine protease
VIRARRAVVLAAVMLLPACGADLPDGVVGLTHTGCPPEESHGSGIEIEPGLVLTAAHVLKGADEIVVTNGRRTTTATVVAFDPTMDLALVRIADPLGAPTPLAERADVREADVEGRTGVAYVVREGTVRAIPVAVRRMINLRTEDIYIDGEYDRPAWELDADTAAGDSGGAVVIDGRVIGVLSLRSNRYESRAYAIDPIRGGATIRDQLATGDLRAVDLTRCT